MDMDAVMETEDSLSWLARLSEQRRVDPSNRPPTWTVAPVQDGDFNSG